MAINAEHNLQPLSLSNLKSFLELKMSKIKLILLGRLLKISLLLVFLYAIRMKIVEKARNAVEEHYAVVLHLHCLIKSFLKLKLLKIKSILLRRILKISLLLVVLNAVKTPSVQMAWSAVEDNVKILLFLMKSYNQNHTTPLLKQFSHAKVTVVALVVRNVKEESAATQALKWLNDHHNSFLSSIILKPNI